MKTIIIDGIEYNLTPKVLFKKGDFVVIQETTYQITKVENLNVTLSLNGRECLFDIDVLKNARLWDITKDAKDGEVLATPNYIYIFNSIDKETETVAFYCLIKKSDKHFSFGDYRIQDEILNSTPATKKQYDTLLKAMADARYEWDAEKKELKKISQRMVSAEAKEALYDKPTDNDMVEALRTEYEKGRADVLRCIDPDVMVADFCSQPLSMTRSIASIYRQGIIDIIKRINRNEETSINSTRSIDDVGL